MSRIERYEAPDEALASLPGDPAAHEEPALARKPRFQPGLLTSWLFLLLMAGWALAPGLFAFHDPLAGIPAQKLRPPSIEHLFGTDQLGRDLYARVVHGAALSLQATALAVAVGLAIGSAIGLLAGFVRGWVDVLTMRILDAMMAVPGLLTSLAVIVVLGFGTINVAIAVGISAVATFARIMRADVLRATTSPVIEAAVIMGAGRWHMLARHVIPHSLGSVVALAALEFASAILAVSALSFLGFGAAPPQPEWGSLIATGRNYMVVAPWLTVAPGLVIMLCMLSANRISQSMDRNLS
ncbi:ABC transporter permease [Rhizobium puerariae]|uniref:ABC transporter permease n=1 Tax=Rhizobium puerariae TaxID=1585791 RepID=A0ABV6ADJ8_9HYPH